MFGLARKKDFFQRRDAADTLDAPDALWIEDALQETFFTHDVARLERSLFQKVFLYNNMMLGHPSNSFIRENSVRLMHGYTSEKFQLWKTKLARASYPVALDIPSNKEYQEWFEGRQNIMAPIHGELYLVESHFISKLDKELANGVIFQRQRIRVTVPYRADVWSKQGGYDVDGKRSSVIRSEERIKRTSAWAYLGIPDYWKEQMSPYLMEPVKIFKPKTHFKDFYYYFSKMEYRV